MAPWRWGREVGLRKEAEDNPLVTFQKAINSLFDDFFHGVDFGSMDTGMAKFNPRLDMAEDDKNITITAELPGLDEKDIEINLSKDILTIKGEKKEEKEEKGKERYYMERSFGSFQRMISIPAEVDTGKVDATFKKGVLNITLPKLAKAKEQQKKIQIKAD
ncbi:MAG TPA: Hsp20/alpha crystallin family protein [Bacteroidales bacterium]|nr:Hsp20/alpha crystallin family protein [Bacteroidales bacterium]